MYAYCLYCIPQRCRVIAKLMEVRGVGKAFSPQIIRKQRKQGVNVRHQYDLLPGYVFLFSEEKLTDYRLFCGMDGVLRRVGKTEDGYELTGPDYEFAMRLMEKDGLIGGMTACRLGDEVRLEDPLFNGCEGKVIRIDYRKERARVAFVFDHAQREIWVSLDEVRQMNPPGEEQSPCHH